MPAPAAQFLRNARGFAADANRPPAGVTESLVSNRKSPANAPEFPANAREFPVKATEFPANGLIFPAETLIPPVKAPKFAANTSNPPATPFSPVI